MNCSCTCNNNIKNVLKLKLMSIDLNDVHTIQNLRFKQIEWLSNACSLILVQKGFINPVWIVR